MVMDITGNKIKIVLNGLSRSNLFLKFSLLIMLNSIFFDSEMKVSQWARRLI